MGSIWTPLVRKSAQWDEQKHPRADDGKFGSGSGGGGGEKTNDANSSTNLKSEKELAKYEKGNIKKLWEVNKADVMRSDPSLTESMAGSVAAARILRGANEAARKFRDEIDAKVSRGEPITDDEDEKYIAAESLRKSIYQDIVNLSGYRPHEELDEHPQAKKPVFGRLGEAVNYRREELYQDNVKAIGNSRVVHLFSEGEGGVSNIIIHPSSRGDKGDRKGKWQVSWSDEKMVPFGDSQFDTFEEAMQSALGKHRGNLPPIGSGNHRVIAVSGNRPDPHIGKSIWTPLRTKRLHVAKAGRWITIGGKKGEDGKRSGGSRVYIENGKITRGHPSLTGKKIAALDQPGEGVGTRKANEMERGYARATWGKKAKAEGIEPKHLHQLAADFMAHDSESQKDKLAMLKDARSALDEFGGTWRTLAANAGRRGPEEGAGVRGMDEVSEHMRSKYPHLFRKPDGENGSLEDQLFDMLKGGNPEQMAEDDAYEQAMAYLLENKREPKEEDDYFAFGANAEWKSLPTPLHVRKSIPGEYDESKHNRDHGKFASSPGSSRGTEPKAPAVSPEKLAAFAERWKAKHGENAHAALDAKMKELASSQDPASQRQLAGAKLLKEHLGQAKASDPVSTGFDKLQSLIKRAGSTDRANRPQKPDFDELRAHLEAMKPADVKAIANKIGDPRIANKKQTIDNLIRRVESALETRLNTVF